MAFIPDTLIYVCDKTIGSSFANELEEYGGLMGQHFTWIVPGFDGTSPAWLEFFEDTPEDVISGVLEVFQAHDPD